SKVPGLTGGLQFVGVDGHPRSQYTPDRNNWGPRVGMAFQANSKTVVRLGYGHLFGISPQESIGTVGPYGFRVENTWQTSADGGLTPLNLLRNPYPLRIQASTRRGERTGHGSRRTYSSADPSHFHSMVDAMELHNPARASIRH